MAYAKFRSDNANGTHFGGNLISVMYKPSNVDTAIENGNVVLIGAQINTDVYAASTPAANSPLNKIAIIGSEEVLKDKGYNSLGEFRNEAGDICRGYRLGTGMNVFSVTAEALDGTGAKGKIVELKAGTKLKVVDSLTSGSTKVGTIVAVEGEYFVIESVC